MRVCINRFNGPRLDEKEHTRVPRSSPASIQVGCRS